MSASLRQTDASAFSPGVAYDNSVHVEGDQITASADVIASRQGYFEEFIFKITV